MIEQLDEDGDRDDGALVGVLLAGALDVARVIADGAVFDCSRHDGVQEPVGLRHRDWPERACLTGSCAEAFFAPAPDRSFVDLAEVYAAEGGLQVVLQQPAVELLGARALPPAGRLAAGFSGADVVACGVLGQARIDLLPDVVQVITLAQDRDDSQGLPPPAGGD